MNERIKELIQAADRQCSETRGVYDEILAELIVRECAAYIFVLDAEPVSHKSAARMLMNHFGVEE